MLFDLFVLYDCYCSFSSFVLCLTYFNCNDMYIPSITLHCGDVASDDVDEMCSQNTGQCKEKSCLIAGRWST